METSGGTASRAPRRHDISVSVSVETRRSDDLYTGASPAGDGVDIYNSWRLLWRRGRCLRCHGSCERISLHSIFAQSFGRFCPFGKDFVLKKRTSLTRRAADGSDAGAWVRRAHGTAAGTRAANPDQRQPKSSAPGLSTGSDCWQSCTAVPGKAVSSWTGELGKQPILTTCAVSAHTLLLPIYLLLLALQVSAWTGFIHHHGPNQGTRRHVLCRAAMHSVVSRCVA